MTLPPRASRRGRWRAATLLGVHGLIAAHAAHYLATGRTLSPVEPSESMYTLELGWVNAGAIFFGLALAATAIFGRFFCGWGCHIVALQDACGWVMKRLGVRPRPLRSRVLALLPVGVAFYMFFWPTIKRLMWPASAAPFPGFTSHLTTTSFWATFPGPLFAVLTLLVCGAAAVYVLGAKGFCTYGCPYGVLFAGVDRFAPGRIVASDACAQCGHCTAACTSNVIVHLEVKQFRRVTDPGCMKCLDCVSVCPTGALSFAFAAPAPLQRPLARRERPQGLLAWHEELLVGAVALGGTLAYRGLYDGPPLLLSVGLGGIVAYAALLLARLARRPEVRLQSLLLKSGGRVRPAGWVAAGVALGMLAFTGHGGFVQWHRARGVAALEQTEATRAEVMSGAARARTYSARHVRAAEAAYAHFALADRFGLVDVAEVKLGLAWCRLLRGDAAAAEGDLRGAIRLQPASAELQQDLFALLRAEGRTADALAALERKFALAPPSHAERCALAEMLADAGRLADAAREFAPCVEALPDAVAMRFNYGGVLRRLGRNDEAIVQLAQAARLGPNDPDTAIEFGLACMAAGRDAQALAAFRRAIALAPDSAEARDHLPQLIREIESRLPR